MRAPGAADVRVLVTYCCTYSTTFAPSYVKVSMWFRPFTWSHHVTIDDSYLAADSTLIQNVRTCSPLGAQRPPLRCGVTDITLSHVENMHRTSRSALKVYVRGITVPLGEYLQCASVVPKELIMAPRSRFTHSF